LGWTDSHLWELTFGRTGFGIPDPSYDFGDGWEHSVKIQGIAPADPQGSYPRVLEATGMRTPEDSGGPWGYAEKLDALTDPAHEYHEEALEALGDDHDAQTQPNIAVIHARFAALAKKIGAPSAQGQIAIRQRRLPSALTVQRSPREEAVHRARPRPP
jgi:hypothetical protein